MNRRRILNTVHRSLARGTSAAVAAVDHSTVERLSIADLDRIGPRLVTTAPVERPVCAYCADAPASDATYPYCSTGCAVRAEQS